MRRSEREKNKKQMNTRGYIPKWKIVRNKEYFQINNGQCGADVLTKMENFTDKKIDVPEAINHDL